MKLPTLSDHASEVGLLSFIAAGVIMLLIVIALRGITGWDVAACLMILQRVIEAITARWTQRSVDRMGQQLATTVPAPESPTKTTVEQE